MRKFVLSLLLLAGAVTTANVVFAGDWENFPNGREPAYRSSHTFSGYAGSLRGSAAAADGDTTYVGYSPGSQTAANPWGIKALNAVNTPGQPGGAGGPLAHRPPKAGCMWNWDPEEASGNGYPHVPGVTTVGDSLQGWWPIRLQWRYLLDTTQEDFNLPTASADYGNFTNYYPRNGRTFGVVGVWHRDQGGDPTGIGTAVNGQASNGVTWRALEGSYSAWCGLRNAADATAPVDPITKNPFTSDAAIFQPHIRFNGALAALKFPGYIDQWDQMLYRDIDMSGNTGSDLTVGFTYSTRMSVTADLIGWFDKDPLTVTSDGSGANCAEGNFISNWDLNGLGPVDSFMVYVGQPVEGTFQPFNGTCADPVGPQTIYDPLRRWFDEVVAANDPGKVVQLVSAAGNDSNHVSSLVIPNSQISSILGASGGKIRLVFRVKTNSQVSDISNASYNSRGRGAAQVDNVTYSHAGGSSPAGWGTFEGASDINNSTTAALAWRSTGKPPSIQTHVAKLGDSGVPYDDLCGSDPTQVGRVCAMFGGIITFGSQDYGGRLGDPTPYTVDHETSSAIMSPTIQLRSNNGVWPNTIGILAPGTNGGKGDAIGTADVSLDYETFTQNATADAPPTATGILYRWLLQSWPQLTAGVVNGNQPIPGAGKKQWGNIVRGGQNYQTDAICFRSLPGITGQEGSMKALGMFKWDASAGENSSYPDSIKVGWIAESLCWLDGVNACNPVGGVYIDNVSLCIIDGNPLPISAEIWNFWQTSFPWNDAVAPVFNASFDTAGVLVKTGLDIGPLDGLNSFNVPADSIVASATGTAPMRMDLVFRVLPGPGNYVTVGNSNSGLATNPQASGGGRTAAVANVASTNFWESYLANNGPFGGPGGSPGAAAHPAGKWDPNRWNSARCDTAEVNLFPRSVGAPQASTWMGTYHEEELGIGAGDAYTASTVVRSGLGLLRHKCFLASATANLNDIDCIHDPPATGSGYDLTWVTAVGSGYNGQPSSKEGTKIIPDGLLTPGAHVEYFWRKSEGGSTALVGTLPDTNIVVPQLGERNNDGHRFAGFGALPDRWKQSGYVHPLGITQTAPACMLVVNDQTTNGYDWLCWSGTADTIGATAQNKWGAEVGWHAVGGGADINQPGNNLASPGQTGTFPRAHLGNPGSTWDGYQIIAAEDTGPAGSFGARYAHADASNTQINGKRAQNAPTLEQLKAFYKIVLWFTGNLNAFAMGPSGNRGSDDQQLIKDWLVSGSPASLNRVFWASGDGFVEGNEKEADPNAQPDLDLNYLGVGLQNAGYRIESGNGKTTVNLVPVSGSPVTVTPNGIDPTQYGVRNTCTHSNDVLKVGLGAVQSLTSVMTEYETSSAIHYPAGILKVHSNLKPWAALTEGYSIMDLMSKYGSDTRGRSKYFYAVLTRVFNAACNAAGTPIVSLDVPNADNGNLLVDFVNLRNNPLTSGVALVHFGLAKDDKVQIKVYDVTGREVRELADRAFKAGEYTLRWDGTDNSGRAVPRGVYFTQVKYQGSAFSDAKKLTVLK